MKPSLAQLSSTIPTSIPSFKTLTPIVPSNAPSSKLPSSLPLQNPTSVPIPNPTSAPITGAPITKAPFAAVPLSTAPVTQTPVTSTPVTKAPIATVPITTVPVTAFTSTNAPAIQITSPTGVDIPDNLPSDWSTSGYNIQRTGLNPYETIITTTSVKTLHQKWYFPTPGAVYAQPVTVTNFDMPSGTGKNVAYFGDEMGNFFAVDIATGKQEWTVNLGVNIYPACGDFPNKYFSITGSATFDRSLNAVYVVGGSGSFNAISMTTGAILWQIKNFYNPQLLHNYGGLLLVNNIIYAEFASMCDTGSYIGALHAVDIVKQTLIASYLPSKGGIGGGMWGLGGATFGDSAAPAIYTPTGNCIGKAVVGNTCEQIVKLDPYTLAVIGTIVPPLHGGDDDFGSTATYFNGAGEPRLGGCQHPMVSAFRKDGTMMIAPADSFLQAQAQTLVLCSNVPGFIQQASWDPDSNTLIVPAYCSKTLVAYKLDATCQLVPKWTATTYGGASGSVTIAGPVGQRVGIVAEGVSFEVFDVQTGAFLLKGSLGNLKFSKQAPVIVSGTVMFPTTGGSASYTGVAAWSP